jgi:hypothetical protein
MQASLSRADMAGWEAYSTSISTFSRGALVMYLQRPIFRLSFDILLRRRSRKRYKLDAQASEYALCPLACASSLYESRGNNIKLTI